MTDHPPTTTNGRATSNAVNDPTKIHDWELGLPDLADLTPLSQAMLPPELASAFSISPELYHSSIDVSRASHSTLSSLRGELHALEDTEVAVGETSRKSRKIDNNTNNNSNNVNGNGNADGNVVVEEQEEVENDLAKSSETASSKRQRLVWTPQLHKRFVDVVAHLGIKNAVPKTIMQMMNVEGLTRENVASHLQKYRLYLKRMHDGAGTGSEQGSESGGSGHAPNSVVGMPYVPGPGMMPMPIYGGGGGGYHVMQQRDWGTSNQ